MSVNAYQEFIHLADVVVDMRYPSGAETSASISRAMAFGKALVLSAQGTFLEIPDDICVKIRVGHGEVGELADVLSALATDRRRAESTGRAARQYALSNLTLELAAHRYIDLAEEVICSNLQAGPWNASPKPQALERLLISTNKAFRTVNFLRTYGLAETIGRVREELSRRAGARSGSSARLQSGDDNCQ